MSVTSPARLSPVSLRAGALTLSRGGRVLLRDLSLEAGPGEALILTGPNGAGKTTLLRALAGLIRPDAGRVAITPASDAIAFLGHADGLKPGESVREALSFWTRLHGGDLNALEPVMEALAVAHLAGRACATLSAGQRRRTALARIALSNRPAWLLDEPSAPLDARSRERLASIVAAHRAAGGCVIATTHAELGWPGTRTLEVGR
jgi:heme exporter protein A